MQRQSHRSAILRPATWLTLLQHQPGDLVTSTCFGSHISVADTLTLLINASAMGRSYTTPYLHKNGPNIFFSDGIWNQWKYNIPTCGCTCWKQAFVRSPSKANELCRTSGIGSCIQIFIIVTAEHNSTECLSSVLSCSDTKTAYFIKHVVTWYIQKIN